MAKHWWKRYNAVYPYAYLFREENKVAEIENTIRDDWRATVDVGRFKSEKEAREAVEKFLKLV